MAMRIAPVSVRSAKSASGSAARRRSRAAPPEATALAMQARQLADAYKIDAVPAMGVQGRYYTNGSLASTGLPAKGPAVGNERMLGVVDALITKVRKPG